MAGNEQKQDVISRILNYPWHFISIIGVLMLQGYLVNPELFALEQVLLYTAVAILIGIVAFLVVKRFMLLHNAGLLVMVLAALFFTYGTFYEVTVTMGIFLRFLAVNLPLFYLGLAALITVLLILQKRQFVKLTVFLNVMAFTTLVGILVNLPNVVVSGTPPERIPNPALADVQRPDDLPDVLPDVYYILLDGYPSNAFLESHFGIDNSDFTSQLEDIGFYIAADSLANYTYTVTSLMSSLNMDYLDRFGTPDTYINSIRHFTVDNLVAHTFQEMGYEYIQVAGGFLPLSETADLTIDVDLTGAVVYLDRNTERSTIKRDYMVYLYRMTLLRLLDPAFANIPGNLNAWDGADRLDIQINALQRIPQRENPTFTYFHLLKPHTPIALDRDGNRFLWVDHYATLSDYLHNEAQHYEDQLIYTNRRILETIEIILRESATPPIIIVQGDHAQQLELRWNREQVGNYPLPILNAYYFPDGDYSSLMPDIAPINTFRVIFSQYFGLNYELLPQRSYFQPYPSLQDHIRKMDFQLIGDGQLEPPYSAATEQ